MSNHPRRQNMAAWWRHMPNWAERDSGYTAHTKSLHFGDNVDTKEG